MIGSELIEFLCPSCKHKWSQSCPVEFQDGEEVTMIGMFDDVCPKCGTQADVYDEDVDSDSED